MDDAGVDDTDDSGAVVGANGGVVVIIVVVAVDAIGYPLKSSGLSFVPTPADIANRQWAAKLISQSIFIVPHTHTATTTTAKKRLN